MKGVLKFLLKLIAAVVGCALLAVCLAASVIVIAQFGLRGAETAKSTQSGQVEYKIMERYDTFMTNTLSDALEGVLAIKKEYWLSDDDLVAPEPNQDLYGQAESPADLQWLLDDAQDLLEGQDTLFDTDIEIMDGSKVMYYLDETILVITWKQVIENTVYTISEVKIADPSQFRRFLADGVYASGTQYVATEMAASVNAVVASNGDFYSFRDMGIVVYDGQLMRTDGRSMDTCFIDANGDMQFAYRKDMQTQEEMEKYVEENGVRFSISFGPILIDGGEICSLYPYYPVGEGDVHNPRAALCQLDSLHYLLVAVSAEPPYQFGHTLPMFAEHLKEMGVIKAYNLDGGQSATIVMNDQKVNYVYQRLISDIIYFATAVPDGG